MVQLLFRFRNTGTFSVASHVLFWSVPAFCHCVLKPEEAGGGICSNWSYALDSTKSTVKPYLFSSSPSMPNSASATSCGLRALLPSWLADSVVPPPPIENVWYWASNPGRIPAVPYDARSLKLSNAGRIHHGSSEMIQAPDTRP